jgi:hypothetical protein
MENKMIYQLTTVNTGAIVITGTMNEIEHVLEAAITGERNDIVLPVRLEEVAQELDQQLAIDGVQVLNMSISENNVLEVHCAYKYSFVVLNMGVAHGQHMISARYYIGQNYVFCRNSFGSIATAAITTRNVVSSLFDAVSSIGQEIKNTIDTHEPNVRWAKFLADHKKLYLSSARYKVKSFSL